MDDYHVSSKWEARGVLAGLILGKGRRNGQNFFIQHPLAQLDYVLFKQHLLEGITHQQVSLRERNGLLRLDPKLRPLTRVLVARLFRGDRPTITRKFLDYLTPEGIAIWFMDQGSKTFRKQNGQVRALDIYLNTFYSRTENEIVAIYFREVWGWCWGLSSSRRGFRLRLGTKAGKEFLAFLRPYIPEMMLFKVDTSYNRTVPT